MYRNKLGSLRPVGLLLVASLAACSDGGPELAPSQIRISIDDGIIARVTAPFLSASVTGALVAVSPDTVESLEVEFTDIAYLPEGADETTESSWQSLTLPAPVTLDLMALPTEGQGSVVIAAGSAPVGSYRKVRLMVGDGEIVFKGPIAAGGGPPLDGGTIHAVTIPSGAQTGLKTDVAFTVTAGADGSANAAEIVFEAGTTFQNVTVTGSGGVMLAPVLRSGT